jgi:hypothetical protein
MPDLPIQRTRSADVTVRMHIGTLAVMLMPNDQDSMLTYVTIALDRHKSRLSREALALADRNYLGGSIAGNVFVTALQLRLLRWRSQCPSARQYSWLPNQKSTKDCRAAEKLPATSTPSESSGTNIVRSRTFGRRIAC